MTKGNTQRVEKLLMIAMAEGGRRSDDPFRAHPTPKALGTPLAAGLPAAAALRTEP